MERKGDKAASTLWISSGQEGCGCLKRAGSVIIFYIHAGLSLVSTLEQKLSENMSRKCLCQVELFSGHQLWSPQLPFGVLCVHCCGWMKGQ